MAKEDGRLFVAMRTAPGSTGKLTCGLGHSFALGNTVIVDISHSGNPSGHFDYFEAPIFGEGATFAQPDFSSVKLPSGAGMGTPGLTADRSEQYRFFNSLGYKAISASEIGNPKNLKLIYHPEITPDGGNMIRRFGEGISYEVRHAGPHGSRRADLWTTVDMTPGEPYIQSSDAYDVGSLRHAGTHVAWLKGEYKPGEPHERQNVELWASPYAAKGADLKPEKVESLPHHKGVFTNEHATGAGFGKVALAYGPDVWDTIWLWDLATKAKTEFKAPKGGRFSSIKGITKEYMWVLVDDKEHIDYEDPYLARYKLTGS